MPRPGGGYKLANGTSVPGVTTILSRFKESGGLINWAWTQGRDGKELYEARDTAADVGTVAHALVEQHINRLTFKETLQDFASVPSATLAKANQAFDAFKTWERHSNLKIVYTEVSLTCECHCYGGTLDAVGEIDEELCLLDFKSGAALYVDALYQMAAYRHLFAINHPGEPLTGGFHLLRFSKSNGDFDHKYFADLNEEWEAFTLMRRLYDIDRAAKKRLG